MAQIILHLADDLAERLAPFRDRLPELLERGLRDLLGTPAKACSTCEKELEEAYALAAQETDSAWDITVADGLTDEAW